MLNAVATRSVLVAAGTLIGILAVTALGPDRAAADTPKVGGDDLYNADTFVSPTASPLPQVGAESFVVADLDTGDILAAHNAHTPLPPASTLKMLTALTLLPRLDPEAVYTATSEDADVIGSRVGILSGSTYTARQLLEAMFLVSGNDASMALARMNGSVEDTVGQMQARAGMLQAYDTVVRNPSGLDSGGQVSSAYDLALIARAGMARSDFAGLASLTNASFPEEGTDDPTARPSFRIWNQNDIVTGEYSGGLGVKSGYTSRAGRTLAAAAERDGHRYLVTMMGIEGATYQTGARYLDWAFANGATVEPVGSLVPPRLAVTATDTAGVVPPGERIPAEMLASGVIPASGSDAAPERGRWYLAGFTLALCLVIREGLRAQYRRAIRRKSRPLAVPEKIPAEVGVLVGTRPRISTARSTFEDENDWVGSSRRAAGS